jgi:hypothetical protein
LDLSWTLAFMRVDSLRFDTPPGPGFKHLSAHS